MMGQGSPSSKSGLAIHMYAFGKSMEDEAMQNADGDFLLVPQRGELVITTECGVLEVPPRHIAVIPRGIVFKVALKKPEGSHEASDNDGGVGEEDGAVGYILETFKGHFELPSLGPIGSNGLANPRDFEYPVASFDRGYADVKSYTLYNKFGGEMFRSSRAGTPFNVVAWHGNYAPYRYDLEKFCCVNSVTFDHPDPSIYTVLTVKSDTPGTATADFVIFPPRWMVMEGTFRPPWYHRNTMTEFMGMVYGKYDAKEGFRAGGCSLHSCMTPHGPDAPTFDKASNAQLKPEYFDGGLAFMFETSVTMRVNKDAMGAPWRDKDYFKCWEGIPPAEIGKEEEEEKEEQGKNKRPRHK